MQYSFKYFPSNRKQRYWTVVFQVLFIPIFVWNTLAFFHSAGNFPFSRHDLKINSKGLQIEASQIFIIRILIISWPCALFGSRFLVIFRMSSLVKWIIDSNLWVFFERTEGRSLFMFIREYCLAKKLLNTSAFSLKFVV